MKEELVTFEVLTLATDLGFDGRPDTQKVYGLYDGIPTQSLLQKWLRDEHDIIVEVHSQYMPNSTYKYGVKVKHEFYDSFDTYEEALEMGLKEGLKLI